MESTKKGVPSSNWLRRFFKYIVENGLDLEINYYYLKKYPLVPDNQGMIRPLGLNTTPLMPVKNDDFLLELLKDFKVPIVSCDKKLLKQLKKFRVYIDEKFENHSDKLIWNVRIKDLIDSMHVFKNDWDKEISISKKIFMINY